MRDIFTNDIFGTIEPPHETKFNLIGTVLPTNQDMYFAANGMKFLIGIVLQEFFLERPKRTIGITGSIPLKNQMFKRQWS